MVSANHLPQKYLYVIIAAAITLVLIIDLLTPLGYAEWIFYIVPVALCLLATDRYAPLAVAALCTTLLAAGYLLSPPTELPFMSIANRTIGMITLWMQAGAVFLYIRSRADLQRLAWIQQSRVQFSLQMQGEQTTNELASNVLRAAASYLDAKVGAVYLLEEARLQRLASWAIHGVETTPRELALGDGLLGQAALDRKTTSVSGLAADYLKVGSALGSGSATHVVVTPLTADGATIGAMELGFTHLAHPIADILEVIRIEAESIGHGLRSALYRTQLATSLEETQRQSEELQVQQEELRVSNEELEERSRALMDSQSQLETQQAELEQSNSQLEEHTLNLEKQKQYLLAAQRSLTENAEALKQANQYKSEFLANMSHELRTPLNSSLILAKLLAENKDDTLSPDQVRYAETIYSSNTDLLVLINDILDLSKIEAGHIDIQPEPVTISSILDAMRQVFEPVASQKKLVFRTEQAPGAPELLVTDNQRLQQILKNLLSNAFKFTEQGEVALRASAADKDHIRFDVIDSGIGISPAQRDAIFGAFHQADGTTSRKYGGTGLGLSISRQFAQLLGGDISVTSEVGTGSVFSLTIALEAQALVADNTAVLPKPQADIPAPLIPSPARASTPTPESAPPVRFFAPRIEDDRHQRTRGSRLIQVIEDDLNFARILYDLAHELDFDCTHASTAEDGIELARETQPCGILLDMNLPDNSGLMVLEHLKRDPATRHIPVHVVSVADHEETALLLGAVGYTFKPTQREKLAEAIGSLEARLEQRVRRILVVEDDPALCENIQLLLQGPDIVLNGVGTMADALEQLRTNSFDCMIMDLALPDGSGYDLLEKMASNGQYAFPPVIVYTGHTLTVEEEQRLRRYSKSIIIKGARSPERLLDEVTLFLHSVESELPIEQQRMLKEARKRDSAFEDRHILLAEDDVRNIFALSQIIEPLGARLEIARNGREALDLLARNDNIDLVLMDIMMPEMDGLTAIKEIRKQGALSKLPIIALTAKAMPADRQRCLDAGANDYISKPLDVDKLLSLCRVWLPQ